MLTSARLILHSHRLATKLGCLASTGIIKALPGSTNTVPGTVRFSLDTRSSEDQVLLEYEKQLKNDFESLAQNVSVEGFDQSEFIGKGCEIEWTLDFESEATKFDPEAIECVRDSANELFKHTNGELVQTMTSGAGHDSVRCLPIPFYE